MRLAWIGGFGISSIVTKANKEGWPAPGKPSVQKSGESDADFAMRRTESPVWHTSTVGRLLRNRSVLGEYQPCVYDGEQRVRVPSGPPVVGYYPAVIDETTFLRAQAKAQRSGRFPGRRDWLRHAHAHRTAANSVFCAVARSLDEDPGYSELEIRAGEAPAALSAFSYTYQGESICKVPDLLLHGSDDGAPIWVEVENSCRSARDLERVVAFLRCLFLRPEPPISKVWFVVTSQSASRIGQRLQAAMTHAPEGGASRLVKELDARILAERIVVMNLNPDRLELTRV